MDTESSPHIPSFEALRELAESRGVHPSDADLEAVLGFLRSILPQLEALERVLPPETAPLGAPQ